LEAVRGLSDNHWSTVVSTNLSRDKYVYRSVGATLAERSAVDRLVETVTVEPDLIARLRPDGRSVAIASQAFLPLAAWSVAFPELLDARQFEAAVAPFVAAGIDCHGLAPMGRVETR